MAKRKRKSGKRRHRRAKFLSNPKRRRFRRNPRIPGAGLLHNTIVPAAIGAAGAIGVDILLGTLPMPWQLRQGPMLPLVRIGLALLLGAAVGAVSNKEAGEEAAAGAVIVTLYGLTRNMFVSRFPGMAMSRYVPLNGLGNRTGGVMRMPNGQLRRYVPMNGMGQRMVQPPGMRLRPGGGGNMRGLAYMQPARQAQMNGMGRGMMRHLATRG